MNWIENWIEGELAGLISNFLIEHAFNWALFHLLEHWPRLVHLWWSLFVRFFCNFGPVYSPVAKWLHVCLLLKRRAWLASMLRFIWHHATSCLSRCMVLCTASRLTGCPCRPVSPQHHARNKGNYKGRRTTRLPVCIPSWAWATLAVACRGAFGRHTLLHGVQICEKSKKQSGAF